MGVTPTPRATAQSINGVYVYTYTAANGNFTGNSDGTYTYVFRDSEGNVNTYIIAIDLGNITRVSEPTPTPETTPTNVETPAVDEIEPEVQRENLSNIEENDTDYTLKNSNIQTFSREKGDYIDLDLQDHTLENRTDVKETIDVLPSSPEEFAEATSRNQVDGVIELNAINENAGEDQPPEETEPAVEIKNMCS